MNPIDVSESPWEKYYQQSLTSEVDSFDYKNNRHLSVDEAFAIIDAVARKKANQKTHLFEHNLRILQCAP